jgi:hypothetical protein
MQKFTAEQLETQLERVHALMVAVCKADTIAERTRLQAMLTDERLHLENMVQEMDNNNVITTENE